MAEPSPSFALVLAGGNALGAYQAGVYEALAEAGIEPARIAGVSAGAINGALIAGNAPVDRLDRLRAFWRPSAGPPDSGGPIDTWRRTSAVAWTMANGRDGLFTPQLGDWSVGGPSLYDSRPLADTLARLIDLDRLNHAAPRFQAVAVDVESGREIVFDTAKRAITPDQLRASAGLIPVLPPVEIDGRVLVDAGLSANVPLDPVLADVPENGLICLAVDLLPLAAPRPKTLSAVAERMQDLVFACQGRRAAEMWGRVMDAEVRAAAASGAPPPPPVTLLHLHYADQADEVVGKAFDFSPASIAARWAQGRRDAAPLAAAIRAGAFAGDQPGLTVRRFHGRTPE